MATDNSFTGELTDELLLKHEEHDHILQSTALDREWWMHPDLRFNTDEDGLNALAEGKLVRIPFPNTYFGLEAGVRQNPNLQLLRPDVLEVLMLVLKELNLRTNFVSRGLRLIMTSFYRSDDLQEQLAASPYWYRVAAKGTSSHAAGAAFDFQLPTHYILDSAGNFMGTWKMEAREEYDAGIFSHLGDILAEMQEKGLCNMVIENEIIGTESFPICLHVCISPDSAILLGNNFET